MIDCSLKDSDGKDLNWVGGGLGGEVSAAHTLFMTETGNNIPHIFSPKLKNIC